MRSSLIPFLAAVILTIPPTVRADDAPEPIRVIAAVLELSDEQVQSFTGILRARNEVIQPLAQQVQEREAALGRALGSSAPDPAAVGQLLIEIRRIEQQVATASGDANERFEQLLSDEQRQRLQFIRQAAQACQVLPAFRAAGIM